MLDRGGCALEATLEGQEEEVAGWTSQDSTDGHAENRAGATGWVGGEAASEKTSNPDPSGEGQPRDGQGEGHPGRKERLVTVPKARTWPVVATERLEWLQPREFREAGDVVVQRRGSGRHVCGIWGSVNSEVNPCAPDPVSSKWENQDSSLNPKPQFPCTSCHLLTAVTGWAGGGGL